MSYLQWDIGTAVLSNYDEDGFLEIQIDAYGEELSGVVPYEAHAPLGFLSRPHDPDEAGGCKVLYALEGGAGHAWVLSDHRTTPLLPPLKPGGSMMYGGKIKTPAFQYIDGETGSLTAYIPYDIDSNNVAQKAMTLEINVDEKGNESFSLLHGSGAGVTMTVDGDSGTTTIRDSSGSNWISVSPDGITINGPVTVNGSMTSGGQDGTPLVSFTQFAQFAAKLIGAIAGLPGGQGITSLTTDIPLMATKFTRGK